MRNRIILSIALFCVATSYAAADESISQFFSQQSQLKPAPAAAAKYAAHGKHLATVSGPGALRGGAVTRASWYGGGEKLARRTASGEVFRPNGLTAAHRSLPLGTRLIVSANGRSVTVRVNDRGPAAWTGRSLDLSRGAARALGMIGAGTARVSYRVASL